MLKVLTTLKQLLEAKSCDSQNELLFEFLKHLLRQKGDPKTQIEKEVAEIKEDLREVEGILQNLQKLKRMIFADQTHSAKISFSCTLLRTFFV